ncbi:MAG: hypothetical protein IT285_05735 [Bdellovibrionales bacterium]|nr:hypothetical protein [Bdellovibrionales bacterium]
MRRAQPACPAPRALRGERPSAYETMARPPYLAPGEQTRSAPGAAWNLGLHFQAVKGAAGPRGQLLAMPGTCSFEDEGIEAEGEQVLWAVTATGSARKAGLFSAITAAAAGAGRVLYFIVERNPNGQWRSVRDDVVVLPVEWE